MTPSTRSDTESEAVAPQEPVQPELPQAPLKEQQVSQPAESVATPEQPELPLAPVQDTQPEADNAVPQENPETNLVSETKESEPVPQAPTDSGATLSPDLVRSEPDTVETPVNQPEVLPQAVPTEPKLESQTQPEVISQTQIETNAQPEPKLSESALENDVGPAPSVDQQLQPESVPQSESLPNLESKLGEEPAPLPGPSHTFDEKEGYKYAIPSQPFNSK